MTQNENKEILRQVEFYFSDANIVRDEYLKRLMAANEGWAPLDVVNSFGKMKAFKKTVSELEEILKESDILCVESGSVQRKAPIPSFDQHKGEEKTLLVRNFPTDYSLEDVQKALIQHRDRIARIALRRDALKEFKGSVFVELKTKDDLEIFKESKLAIETTTDSENEGNAAKKAKIELEVVEAAEYFAKKRSEKRAEKEKKKQEVESAIVETFKNKLFKFQIEKEGEALEGDEGLKISDIKLALQQAVAFVDMPNKHIRTKEDQESIDPVQISGLTLKFTKLEDSEVVEYCKGLSLSSNKTLVKPRRRVK
ncbi:lupus La protein [Nematocida major]|uniref:lupus La protein n=1 Tax=Nematocida major TaxID=1912982 RepID=UPI0020088EC8|nr:lupus La protein [Nematocida major]KAH9385851.1 lupus La protein [Nematocida major]